MIPFEKYIRPLVDVADLILTTLCDARCIAPLFKVVQEVYLSTAHRHKGKLLTECLSHHMS